jgi:hypothetical protein
MNWWHRLLDKLLGSKESAETMDDLNLNSLDRFSKRSERLLLEQYGSCEVPAGCGGAVLRWRNPADGLPLVFSTVLDANVTILVDSQPLSGSCLIVPPGDHILVAHFTDIKRESGPLLFSVSDGAVAKSSDNVKYVLKSAADGTWLATISAPEGNDWTTADYDDSDWLALTEEEGFHPESLEANWKWRYGRKIEHGVVPLAIPSGGQLWLRKRFHLGRGEQ